MKLVRYSAFGAPEEVLEVVEVPRPEPGETEVRIRLEASPVHLADLKHIRGVPWFDQYRPPHTPGYEGVGYVTAVGAAVRDRREGDRVFFSIHKTKKKLFRQETQSEGGEKCDLRFRWKD